MKWVTRERPKIGASELWVPVKIFTLLSNVLASAENYR